MILIATHIGDCNTAFIFYHQFMPSLKIRSENGFWTLHFRCRRVWIILLWIKHKSVVFIMQQCYVYWYTQITLCSWLWWHAPIIPVLWEAEADWLQVQDLTAQLRDLELVSKWKRTRNVGQCEGPRFTL